MKKTDAFHDACCEMAQAAQEFGQQLPKHVNNIVLLLVPFDRARQAHFWFEESVLSAHEHLALHENAQVLTTKSMSFLEHLEQDAACLQHFLPLNINLYYDRQSDGEMYIKNGLYASYYHQRLNRNGVCKNLLAIRPLLQAIKGIPAGERVYKSPTDSKKVWAQNEQDAVVIHNALVRYLLKNGEKPIVSMRHPDPFINT